MTESASSPYPIRPIGENEFDSFEEVAQHAFNGSPLTESDRRMVLDRFELAARPGCPAGSGGLSAFCAILGAEEDGAVPVMKLTHNTAMRARDVSRPRAEHLAEAEAAEAREAPGRDRGGTGGNGADGSGAGRARTGRASEAGAAREPGADAGREPDEAGASGRTGRSGVSRRRRGARDATRRGRSSR